MRIFGATGTALISVGALISILGTLNGIVLLIFGAALILGSILRWNW